MPVITRTQIVARPVDDVFAVVVDGGNYSTWNPTVSTSRRLDSGPIVGGSRFEWKLKGFGTVVQELQDFEPSRQVRIVPHTRAISGGHRFVFTAEATGTRIDHELEMTPRGLMRLFTPFMASIGRKNLTATAGALQAHLEAQ